MTLAAFPTHLVANALQQNYAGRPIIRSIACSISLHFDEDTLASTGPNAHLLTVLTPHNSTTESRESPATAAGRKTAPGTADKCVRLVIGATTVVRKREWLSSSP